MYKGRTNICKNSYILVRGTAPIMLVAHLDTVHKEPVKQICKTQNGSILMSPQGIGGDDRCGVYALNTVYELSVGKPWLLFTCDEEIGGVGAETFCQTHKAGKLPKAMDELKIIIEIDRKGQDDAVYYDCDNNELEKYISGIGFKTDWGSFSDISYIAPELGTAAVNLSSGYYNAHTPHEYINRKHLNATVRRVVDIVTDAAKPSFPKYEYIERTHFGGRYGGWDDWGWGYHPGKKSSVELMLLEDDPELKGIPADIREEYAALLDFYSAEELEQFREELGDQAISMLFESELGEDYGLPETDEGEEDYWRIGK
ncbi:MAG: hypothetical protein RR365_08890 [Bacteroides sp.]